MNVTAIPIYKWFGFILYIGLHRQTWACLFQIFVCGEISLGEIFAFYANQTFVNKVWWAEGTLKDWAK